MTEIFCPRLPAFDATDFSAVVEAFEKAPGLPMKQTWNSVPDINYQPGWVRLGWQDDRLWVFARMVDSDIFTSARRDNERLWECGDVFEIFLQDMRFPGYVEFHVAPNGRRMQLVFPEADTFQRISQEEIPLENFFRGEPLFDFITSEFEGGWQVVASIPVRVFDRNSIHLAGLQWKASFCRYDGSSRGSDPVLSSTSDHAIASFHLREDWKTLNFV